MRSTFALSFLVAIACKGDAPTETDTLTGECAVDDDCGAGRICEPIGTCVPGDRSNDFDEAVPLELEQEQEAAIDDEGDVDYWAFESTGDEWIRIETVSDEEDVNTVVSLFTPEKRLHALMDEFPTGNVSSFDTVLHAYLPTSGTWYVKVEDRGTFYGLDELGDGDYTLQLKTFTGVTDETDALTDPGATLAFDDGSTIYSVGVNVDEAGDVDFIEVSLPWDDAPIEVYGQSDIPGSEAQVLVELVDPDAPETVLARKVDVGPDGTLLFLDTLEQSYVLRATDADGEGGPDHWYVLYVRTRDAGSFGFVEEEEPNDTSDAPQLVELVDDETNSGSPYQRFDVTGDFDVEADEDWFAADVASGNFVTVWCTADAWGSLADPQVDVYLDDTLLASGTTGNDDAPDLTNLAELDAGGQLRVRLRDEGTAFGPGAYYGCTVFLTPFEVVE